MSNDFYSQIYSDSKGEWSVVDIVNWAENNAPMVVFNVEDLAEIAFMKSENEDFDEVPGSPEFVDRAMRSDLSYPITVIVYPDGDFIADGNHRLWKARELGQKTIRGYSLSEEDLMQIKKVNKTNESLYLLRQLIVEVLDGFGNKNLGKDSGNNLRYDVPILKRGGNVLTDEDQDAEKEDQSTQKAAVCLIMSDDGKVLAVSRRDDPTAWGLPGGKVDPGEEPIQAASRELAEETGLVASRLHPVFSSGDSSGFVTTTFACEATGHIDTDEEGVIRWVDVSVLLDPSTSPFADYNQKLFNKLGTK